MSNDVVLAQLIAIRAQVDAAIAQVVGGADEGCPHPSGKREDRTEMGGPIQFYCRACGEVITPTEGDEEDEGA